MTIDPPACIMTPLEYRVALDIACAWLMPSGINVLYCDTPALRLEALQRWPWSAFLPRQGGLWLEPQEATWLAKLDCLAQELPVDGRLAIVLSLPPARFLPERRGWGDAPMGTHCNGMRRLHQRLEQHFFLKGVYHLHSGKSVLLNVLARLAHALGQPALSDRMGFAARRHYIKQSGGAWPATCALLLATRR